MTVLTTFAFRQGDSGRLGDSDSSSFFQAEDGEVEGDALGQVPDSCHWAVPDVPSPPTASGLYWPKNPRSFSSSSAIFVPDISQFPMRNGGRNHPKRRRNI
ncbi:hypothetical protein M569_12429 [Genlisea aurea]|uniref:Uncharacterized protein n=1 Tax=Genlisea aurea TaxID=192259 RepID=S8C6J5_9LAMI|nr:hypothetical protein M569_12429 [Genlisea aurea]